MLYRNEKAGKDTIKTNLSLEERIEASKNERKKKIMEDFLNDEWIHPVLVAKNRKQRPLRFSGPVPINIDEEGVTMDMTIFTDFPCASVMGCILQHQSQKTKRQNQTKLKLTKDAQLDIGKIIEINKVEFEKYVSVERMDKRIEEIDEDDSRVIGALTDFEVGKKEEGDRTAHDTTTETDVSMTGEEIEKKRVEEFKRKRKEELDVLQEELSSLQGNASVYLRSVQESQAGDSGCTGKSCKVF